MSDEAAALIERYLAAVGGARRVPSAERREVISDLREHIAETYREQMAELSAEADVLVVQMILDDLGQPSAIFGSGSEAHWNPDRVYDVATVAMVAVGAVLLALIGWVIALVMLWRGPRWTTKDKILGTCAWPVAIAVPLATAVWLPPIWAEGVGVLAVVLVVAGWLPFVVTRLAHAAARHREAVA